ncbi:uncharacterized protein LOC101859627 [Aplysia californica]|uniref:Uncharacterized protein LOC101859627 n=1 Tax=Aplysia californica TaxID=6500 RepID=A0ABM0JIL3_APLCA|nr:uncharacterized protein LOC101859627 [Aplysia californica]
MSAPGAAMTHTSAEATSNSYMGKMWRYRNISYKLGIIGLVVSTGFFFLGFVSQRWLEARIYHDSDLSLTDVMLGSHEDWGYGVSDSYETISWGFFSGSFGNDICDSGCSVGLTVTRVLVCICFLSHILGYVVAAVENFRVVDVRTYHTHRLELAVLITGLLAGGSMVSFMYLFVPQLDHLVRLKYGWSTTVMWLSGTILFISCVFIVCGNRKPTVGVVVTQAGAVHMAHYTTTPSQVTVFQSGPAPQPQYPPMSQPQYQPVSQPQGPKFQPQYPPAQAPYPAPASQPLLPAHTAQYPLPNQPMGAPPAYSPAPAYPIGPTSPPVMMGYQPVPQAEGYAQASAPPPEPADTLPEKRRL